MRIKYFLAVIAAISLVSLATGCKNTAHGAGQDIERAGEKIQDKTQ